MSLRTRSNVILTAILSIFASCLSVAQAGWVKVQDNPITIYRDTRTGLEWSVTISEAGNSNAKAQRIVQQYGLRLPTWNELRDVVNNNDAIDWLEIEDGLLDLYETSNPNVLAGAYGGSISTPRPRQALTRTWAIGVRGGSGAGNTPRPPQPPANPNQGGGFTPGQIINPEYGDRIVNINGIAIRDEDHFREIIRNADTRIVFTLIDQRTGNAYRFTTDLLPKGSTTRLGIYIQDDSRGGVMVTGVMDGTPGMNCRYVGSGNIINPPTQPQSLGKVYVLTVWGTNEIKVSRKISELEGEFNTAMEGIKSSSLCASYDTLDGKDASKQNVINKCYEICHKAQKNDVIFVYMCCHGSMRRVGNKRTHYLFPGVKYADQMKYKFDEEGIARQDIISALSPNDHRLVVLITDACATDQEEDASESLGKYAEEVSVQTNASCRLKLLLTTCKGLIDWNSSSPLGGNNRQGEASSLYYIYKYGIIRTRYTPAWSGNTSIRHVFSASPDGNPNSKPPKIYHGIFFDTFYKYAFEPVGANSSITADQFFNELKNNLAHEYNECFKNKDIREKCSAFNKQSTQTLFDFKGTGFVYENSSGNNQDYFDDDDDFYY